MSSQAAAQLVVHMESFLRDSPAARKAMRLLLDELEREEKRGPLELAAARKLNAAPSPPRSPSPREPRAAVKLLLQAPITAYSEIYKIDPSDYGWSLDSLNRIAWVACYKLYMPDGETTLRYSLVNGKFQLGYPRHLCPQFNTGKLYETDYGNVKVAQENFDRVTEAEFVDMLRDPTGWFGRGRVGRFVEG